MAQGRSLLFAVAAAVCLGAGCNQVTSQTAGGQTTASVASSPAVSIIPEASLPAASPMTLAFPGILSVSEIHNKQVRITTTKGDIVFKLYDDTAPNTVSNFVYLASQGFYNGVVFHRVIAGFMIQGGDPTGTGMGGPGYKFADEVNDNRAYTRGTVAMANAGANTNGSQFFIMHQDYPLPHDYSIFGEVISGMDVVDAIAATPTDRTDRPLSEQVMLKVTVEDAS